MATTFVDYTGDGNATKSFSFPSIKEADIKVEVDEVIKTSGNHYNITSYTTTGGGNVVFTSGNIPSSPARIRIFRDTDVDSAKATFTAGSSVKAGDLNNNNKQLLYSAQEEQNQTIQTSKIKDSAVTTAKIRDLNVTTAKIANDAVTADKLPDDVINSEHYAPVSIDTEHIANENVTTAKLANLAVTTSKLADLNVTRGKLEADIIDGTKLADNAVDSEHYVDGSIDRVHLEADIIDSTKLADNAVNSEHYVDGSIDHVHLANDAVDGDNIADDSINSEHIAASAIDTEHIAAGQVTLDKLADNSVNTNRIIDANVTTAKIADANVTTAKIADSNITTAKIADDAVTNAKIADGTLDGRYFTETELLNGALDGRYFTETEADARYFNISTGDTVKDGDTFPDNDTTIATTAAINDRIIDLVDDVGGFVPIANETSFPTANPDVNNGAGTLVSIKAIGSTRTPSTGTVTIANGSGSNTVTITGCGSTVLTAGFGVIVETTTTLHTYAFHRLVPKATEVSTVAANATNISAAGANTANINAVVANASNINTVAGNNANVTTVAGISANVTTVAGISSNVTTVANNNANVTAVAGNNSNITDVADNETNINAVKNNETNINAVANNNSNITAVAGNASNINAAVSNASNINSAVSNASNINSAVSNASNINTVAGSISNVNTTATNIANVNTTATNIADVNNFAGTYQIASSAPSTDGSGNALAEGDLYFDTSSNELRVYNGSSWQGGVTAGSGFASSGSNTFTGDQTIQSALPTINFTDTNNNPDYILRNNNGTFVIRDGTVGADRLQVATDGHVDVTGNLDVGAGIDVTGNITVSGNVDGRDVSADGTKLDGISSGAIANVVQDTTPQLGGLLDSNGNNIKMLDSNIVYFGTGNDSAIFHDGSHLKIQNATGQLRIQGTPNEDSVIAKANGAVELYYDNVKKFETGSLGVRFFGNLYADDNEKVILGSGQDLQIYHNGTSYIDASNGHFYIRNNVASDAGGDIFIQAKSGETSIKCQHDGNIELYYDNVKKFETQSTGVRFLDSDSNLKLQLDTNAGTQGIIYADSNQLQLQTGGGETSVKCIKDGAVELYHDNTKKFQTTANGIELPGSNSLFLGGKIDMPDNTSGTDGKILLGTGDDLSIYHTGSNGNIFNITGDLILSAGATSSTVLRSRFDSTVFNNAANNQNQLVLDAGMVRLYESGTERLRTTSSGVTITGEGRLTSHLVMNTADNQTIYLGAGNDLTIKHDGSNSYLKNITGALNIQGGGGNIQLQAVDGESGLIVKPDAAVELYHNGNLKFETTSTGVKWAGYLYADDGASIRLGNGADLRLYHDGGNSYIDEVGTGNLFIRSNSTIKLRTNTTENAVVCNNNGSVELYHDATKKLETTSAGATVTGTLTATSFSGDGSNLTGVSGAEIYGFNTDTNGNLIVTTTNGGADNISGTTFDAFEDVVFAATGFSFSVNANGKLIATI